MGSTRRKVGEETQLLNAIIEMATTRGWLVHHCRPARMESGKYATPIQGHVGFPDLVLAREGRVIFAELKSSTGRVTAGQKDWLAVLTRVDAPVEAYVWYPKDWIDGVVDRILL